MVWQKSSKKGQKADFGDRERSFFHPHGRRFQSSFESGHDVTDGEYGYVNRNYKGKQKPPVPVFGKAKNKGAPMVVVPPISMVAPMPLIAYAPQNPQPDPDAEAFKVRYQAWANIPPQTEWFSVTSGIALQKKLEIRSGLKKPTTSMRS